MAIGCEHGAACHDGSAPSMATAPEASRAWLLIEHPGPWPAEPTEAEQPGRLGELVAAAAALGIRVQLIRRPGRRGPLLERTVFAGWTAGAMPWLRRGMMAPDACGLDVAALAEGHAPAFGEPVDEPVFLVCVHGRRDVCCARFGVPLAQSLAASYPAQVWETTHVGGHKYAGNLVILPHGLYYGPVGATQAAASIDAYSRGNVLAARYRGRAGQPREIQEKEHAQLEEAGMLPLSSLRLARGGEAQSSVEDLGERFQQAGNPRRGCAVLYGNEWPPCPARAATRLIAQPLGIFLPKEAG